MAMATRDKQKAPMGSTMPVHLRYNSWNIYFPLALQNVTVK